MQTSEQIVAVSFLTWSELKSAGGILRHVYPLPKDGDFERLLNALNEKAEADQVTR